MSEKRRASEKRRVCFVTGTRAEFGLMRSVLRAIRRERGLELQIVATGMHLDASRGRSVEQIEREGWRVDAIVPWDVGINVAKASRPRARRLSGMSAANNAEGETPPPREEQGNVADATGLAIAGLARAFDELQSDIVLVVGDRVEAFAAAAAGHLSGRVVAHVHGGDRALGQVDDSLRHAITKLAHVHFPATRESAARILRLGEDRWRIHRVGSPGIDGIVHEAATIDELRAAGFELRPRSYALLVLHPVDADADVERRRAEMLLRATLRTPFDRVVVIYPNNDPGGDGIVEAWREHERRRDPRLIFRTNVARDVFLGLMRDAAVLVGNSSSGIIEAASFGTPVIDVRPRQLGRERGGNVVNVPYDERAVRRTVGRIWNDGRPKRFRGANAYADARSNAGAKLARVLATTPLDERLRRKLIAY